MKAFESTQMKWVRGAGLGAALLAVMLVGSMARAAEPGVVSFGTFSVSGPSVREGRRAGVSYRAYGQVVKSYGMRNKQDPMWVIDINVTQEKPFLGDVSIHIADTIENLSQVPRTYDLYQQDDRRQAPYATLSIHGVKKFTTYGCEPRVDRENTPAGKLTLTSFGKVGGVISGTIEITEGWNVPSNCDNLGVATKGKFKVLRAVDYEFD